jgi:hypothetical protein
MFLILYWMWRSKNLDGLNGGGWGVLIASTTILAVAVDRHTGQSGGAPDMTLFTVRWVPRQPIVGVWSGWLVKSFLLLRHRTVRCVLTLQFWLLTSTLSTVHYSPQLTVGHNWLLFRWLTGQSYGTPDSLVNYSEVTLRKTESSQFARCLGLGTG